MVPPSLLLLLAVTSSGRSLAFLLPPKFWPLRRAPLFKIGIITFWRVEPVGSSLVWILQPMWLTRAFLQRWIFRSSAVKLVWAAPLQITTQVRPRQTFSTARRFMSGHSMPTRSALPPKWESLKLQQLQFLGCSQPTWAVLEIQQHSVQPCPEQPLLPSAVSVPFLEANFALKQSLPSRSLLARCLQRWVFSRALFVAVVSDLVFQEAASQEAAFFVPV